MPKRFIKWPLILWLGVGITLIGMGCSSASPGDPVTTTPGTPTATPTRALLPTATSTVPPTTADIELEREDAAPPAIPDMPPPITLTINGQTQAAGLGGYCWTRPGARAGVCLDTIGIPTASEPLVVNASFTAQFEMGLAHSLTELQLNIAPVTDENRLESNDPAVQWWRPPTGEAHTLPLEAQPQIELSLEPGRYIMVMFARWQEAGDANYGFLLEVP